MDKKITKEISNLLTSSDKARKAISTEIDKIDAKYRALAEKEKSKLSKMLKSIEEQMESYKTLLNLGDEVEPDEAEPTAVEEEDEKVIDTIFPENNEEPVIEEVDKQVVEEEVTDDPVVVEEAVDETDKKSDEATETVETVETAENAEWPFDNGNDKEEDGWPEFPEEWGK